MDTIPKGRIRVTKADGSVSTTGRKQPRRRQAKGTPWDERRARYWKDHDRICVKCGYGSWRDDDRHKVHLHHIRYGVTKGTESDGQLMGLCADCHAGVHRLARRTGWPISTATYRFRPDGRMRDEGNPPIDLTSVWADQREMDDAFDRAVAGD